MKHYVIIGNGIAAAGCIEGIRSVDPETPVTVISQEKHPVYCRPLISYYLEGKTKLKNIGYRSDDFYEKNGAKVLYGVRAEKIDAEAKTVKLDDGTELSYSALCVAAGSSPFVPPFNGLENVTEKYSFMTLDDTFALEKALFPEAKVLIMGAGLIGLKCAEGIADRVQSITVCDLAPRVLSSILDEDGAARMQSALEQKGVRLCLGDTAEHFEANEAFMKSGVTVPFDILVLAVGVRPNTALVKEAGGTVNRGIVADEKMRTSLKDVYTAGDCTEGPDASIGQNRVLAILPNAYMQGRCAGVNMAGGSAVFDCGIPMNSIGFFGLHTMTAGSSFPAEEGGSVYEEADADHMKKLYFKGDRLTGFALIGELKQTGIYTAMIRNKTPLSPEAKELICKQPTLAYFSAENRGKMLGGVV